MLDQSVAWNLPMKVHCYMPSLIDRTSVKTLRVCREPRKRAISDFKLQISDLRVLRNNLNLKSALFNLKSLDPACSYPADGVIFSLKSAITFGGHDTCDVLPL